MSFNPFMQYGIKEVADVIVYDITTGNPVMYFDTLKVSNIEMTAEQTDARGGKGNPKLISWDYGKEITLTLQDALLSMKSLNLLLAPDGTGNVFHSTSVAKKIKKAELVTLGTGGVFTPRYTPVGDIYVLEGATTATTTTNPVGGYVFTGGSAGEVVRVVYEVNSLTGTAGGGTYEIVVSPDRFPGTYMFVGDTVIRNKNGVDEGFQFIIPKAKIGSEVSFTMEAEGDPSVFDITITVLKADNGTMMSLVKYDIGSPEEGLVNSNLT